MSRSSEQATLPTGSSRQRLRDACADRFRANYVAFQYHLVEFMTAHLVRCCRRFDGDLEEMLVLAIIGQVHLRAELDVAVDGRVLRRSDPTEVAISSSRIADVTGIPRATVRRKLAKLRRRGWVEQIQDSQWKLVFRNGIAPVAGDLDELNTSGLEGVADLMAALRPITGG